MVTNQWNVHAADEEADSVYAAAAEVAESFNGMGIDDKLLIDLMNLPRKDVSYYTRSINNYGFNDTTYE